MSNKRYQVFVSSTYTDLKKERQAVIQTLMEMDCIPAGMELFPAVDEDQFEFIKKIIDDCDYYLLIIGGRYGSETAEGISYTEKEYDYAVKKGIKVIALIHKDIGKLPSEKVDGDPEVKKRLDKFRDKAKKERMVKFWKNSDELAKFVALSLNKTIKTYPAIGWVRADQGSSTEDEIDIFRPFSEVREINSSKRNSCKIDSSYVLWECGTIMCWVYVSPPSEGIRELKKHRYIFAHITGYQSTPQLLYYNRFSLGCLGKNEAKRWEVTLTNKNGKSSTLTIADKLETGWHHFMFSWNRKEKQMSFFIDLGEHGNVLKPVSNWPEKTGNNLTIGTWATDNDGHYCNTKIAYPKIINKSLDCNFFEVIENFNRKPKQG